jgi:localization factor PodJL
LRQEIHTFRKTAARRQLKILTCSLPQSGKIRPLGTEDRERPHRLLTSAAARRCCCSRCGLGAAMNLGGVWNSNGRRRGRSNRHNVYGGRLLAQRRHDTSEGRRRRVDHQPQRAPRASPESINDPIDVIALVRRAAREQYVQQAQTEAAVAAAIRVPSVFARALRRVAVVACFSLFVAGGVYIASGAGLFDVVVLDAPQVISEQQQQLAQADPAPIETLPPPVPTKPAAAAPAGPAQPSTGALPSWEMPEITGALPHPDAVQVPPGPERSVAIVEDKLPATIGNSALRAAAMAGDAAAAYEIASRFAEGRGVPPSNQEEARWLERAARQGLAPAQFRLGGLYEKGIGVAKDLLKASDLYLAAAQKGNAKAMHNLAVLYAEGVSGTPDYKSASVWFREAADHGIKDSQYNLAVLYARGAGVEQNYVESYKWFVLAAIQGDLDAATKSNEVVAHLDPQTLEAARLAVQSWSPELQPDDAINVKTEAAWETPAETLHPAKPKPRPAWGETRTADSKLN